MTPATGGAVRVGALLIATHDLADPNFAGTVVLVVDHSDEGTVGVVLNRPSDVPVSDPLPDCRHPVAEPARVFVGGPVGRDTVIAVGAAERLPEGDRGGAGIDAGPGWQALGPHLGLVDLDAPPPEGLAGVRVFAGYAGWGAEQLREELRDGAWWVFDARPEDLLAEDPAQLWRSVLVRQGGFFTTVPDDPALN